MSGSIIDRLKDHLRQVPQLAALVREGGEAPRADLMLATEAGYAFFQVVEPNEDIVARWQESQGEIARFLERLSDRGQESGAYLALLVTGQSDPYVLNRISTNPYVCRKLVIPDADRKPVEEIVQAMPFLPLPENFRDVLRALPPDPVEVAAETDLGVGFARQLLGTTGIQSIARSLVEPQAELTDQPGQAAALAEDLPDAGPNGRWIIDEVKLQDFRNYGPKHEPIRFCGGLNIIYGPNGTGKTTIYEGLEWAFTGYSSRVQQDQSGTEVGQMALHNLYSEGRPGRVQVHLSTQDGLRQIEIVRSTDSSKPRLDGELIDERVLLLRMTTLPRQTKRKTGEQVLQNAFRYAHFLGQHNMVEFLSENPVDRYSAFSYMVGTELLNRTVERGVAVLTELRRRRRTVERDVEDQERRLKEANENREHQLAKLKAKSGGAVISLEEAARRAAELRQQSGGLGLQGDVAVPGTESIPAWRGWGQGLLYAIPGRREALTNRRQRLLQLINESERALAQMENERTLELARERAESARKEVREALSKSEAERNRLEGEVRAAVRRREELAGQIEAMQRHIVLTAQLSAATGNRDQCVSDLAALEADLRAARDLEALLNRQQMEQAKALKVKEQQAMLLCERLQELRELAGSQVHWDDMVSDRRRIEQRLEDLAVGAIAREERLVRLEAEISVASDDLAERQASLEAVRRMTEERQALLATLETHIHDQDHICLLCGHDWLHTGLLGAAVRTTLQHLPDLLLTAEVAVKVGRERLTDLVQERQELLQRRNSDSSVQVELEGRHADLADQLALVADRVSRLFAGRLMAEVSAVELAQAVEDAQSSLERAQEEIKRGGDAQAVLGDRLDVARRQTQQLSQDVQTQRNLLGTAQAEVDRMTLALQALASDFHGEGQLWPALDTLRQAQKEHEEALRELREREAACHAEVLEWTSAEQAAGRHLQAVTADQEAARELIRSFISAGKAVGVVTEPVAAIPAGLATQAEAADQAVLTLNRFERHVQQFLTLVETVELSERVSELDQHRLRLEVRREQSEAERARYDQAIHQVHTFVQRLNMVKRKEENRRLKSYEPLSQTMYQRLSAHPYFGKLKVYAEDGDVKIHIATTKNADGKDVQTVPAGAYLSAAQRNAVALSIFLSSALLQGWTLLNTLVIDDPVQHMDDMNIFALLDLLEGLVDSGRQIILTTASEDLYRTMLGRFSRLNKPGHQRFQAIRLGGVTPLGPKVLVDTPAVSQ